MKPRKEGAKVVKVSRTNDNQRMRPNGKERHDPFSSDLDIGRQSQLQNIIHNTDLEWLSINWRKYRAVNKSSSNRRLILIMFENDYEYFPSLKEIRDDLIKA